VDTNVSEEQGVRRPKSSNVQGDLFNESPMNSEVTLRQVHTLLYTERHVSFLLALSTAYCAHEFRQNGPSPRIKSEVKVKLSHYTPWRHMGGEEV
jgi:hypothetical protein